MNVTMSFIDPKNPGSKEIDELVSKNAQEGKTTYLIDREVLQEANPDIIFTQELCEVCAVSGNEVQKAVKVLGHTPEIISLEPTNIDEILESIITVGEATNTLDTAIEKVDKLRSRIERIRSLLGSERDRPRVFCLEWLDPPYVGGHWVPEMVQIAGGECGIGQAGKPSFEVLWEDILEFAPHFLFIMPCGFNTEKTLDEINLLTAHDEWFALPSTTRGQNYIVDANSYFSRPGPRIVDGLEILAKTIHPESFKSYNPPPDSVINLRNYMHLELFLG